MWGLVDGGAAALALVPLVLIALVVGYGVTTIRHPWMVTAGPPRDPRWEAAPFRPGSSDILNVLLVAMALGCLADLALLVWLMGSIGDPPA